MTKNNELIKNLQNGRYESFVFAGTIKQDDSGNVSEEFKAKGNALDHIGLANDIRKEAMEEVRKVIKENNFPEEFLQLVEKQMNEGFGYIQGGVEVD